LDDENSTFEESQIQEFDDERTERICSNYGCQHKFTQEDNSPCFSHFGVWDFGHTGISIEKSIEEIKSKKFETILWPPHWTCCGKGWRDSCGKPHVHRGKPSRDYSGKGSGFDVEDEFGSKLLFKKIIRPSWTVQVNKFHKFDKQTVKTKIEKFAISNRLKPEVKSLEY
jgi:hypothetical protein